MHLNCRNYGIERETGIRTDRWDLTVVGAEMADGNGKYWNILHRVKHQEDRHCTSEGWRTNTNISFDNSILFSFVFYLFILFLSSVFSRMPGTQRSGINREQISMFSTVVNITRLAASVYFRSCFSVFLFFLFFFCFFFFFYGTSSCLEAITHGKFLNISGKR